MFHWMSRRIENDQCKLEWEHHVEVVHIQQPSETETADLRQELRQNEQQSSLMKDPNGQPTFTDVGDRTFWTELICDWLAPQTFRDCW